MRGEIPTSPASSRTALRPHIRDYRCGPNRYPSNTFHAVWRDPHAHAQAGWGDDPADIALLAELHEEARTSRPPTPGEIAYDEAHEAITDLWDALAEQEHREYTDYAERLTSAAQARLAALDLPTPVTVNITLAPEGAGTSDDFDDHAPATNPRNAIEAAIAAAIADTPTPSTLPGTPLDRLGAAQP
jgi:hypothetical protein